MMLLACAFHFYDSCSTNLSHAGLRSGQYLWGGWGGTKFYSYKQGVQKVLI
jgi:hypothetical protein